jgi:hypothetical protein
VRYDAAGRGSGRDGPKLLRRASEQAALGRKLAIYDRETGALAYWFVALRCDEECARAARYATPLTVLVIEPASNAREISDEALKLAMTLRNCDIVGYLGRGRFVAILPQTPAENVEALSQRLFARGFERIGSAAYGLDGRTFDQLYAAATAQLAGAQTPLNSQEYGEAA